MFRISPWKVAYNQPSRSKYIIEITAVNNVLRVHDELNTDAFMESK